MDKKQFALEQIKEYIIDPSKCGYSDGECMNITHDGKMCVAGKNLLPEVREKHRGLGIVLLFQRYDYDQSKVLIPESVDILSNDEWKWLQNVHDYIAEDYIESIQWSDENALFTQEELMALKQ